MVSDGKVYDVVLQPLRRLKELKNFYVYMRRVERMRTSNNAYGSDEMKYKKVVMGENCNSRARGKPWLGLRGGGGRQGVSADSRSR